MFGVVNIFKALQIKRDVPIEINKKRFFCYLDIGIYQIAYVVTSILALLEIENLIEIIKIPIFIILTVVCVFDMVKTKTRAQRGKYLFVVMPLIGISYILGVCLLIFSEFTHFFAYEKIWYIRDKKSILKLILGFILISFVLNVITVLTIFFSIK